MRSSNGNEAACTEVVGSISAEGNAIRAQNQHDEDSLMSYGYEPENADVEANGNKGVGSKISDIVYDSFIQQFSRSTSDDDMFEINIGNKCMANTKKIAALSQDDCNNFVNSTDENFETIIKRNNFLKGLLNTKEAQHLVFQDMVQKQLERNDRLRLREQVTLVPP